MPDFLLEIGTEEIPAGYIAPAMEWLKKSFIEQMKKVIIEPENVETFATPRRLTLYCQNILENSPLGTTEIFGPPASAAYDEDGNPTRALKGFASSQAKEIKDVQMKETSKGRYCYIKEVIPSKPAKIILEGRLPDLIAAIPFPKSMYWNEPKFVFARPIRNICAVFGGEHVCFEVNGVKSCAEVFAHPFLSPGTLPIVEADIEKYKNLLRNHFVYVDQNERKRIIREKIENILKNHDAAFTEEELLDEVTFLAEYPGVIEGSFDEKYLSLPAEVVEESMKEHQRYFPIVKRDGTLVAHFITVINRPDEKADAIREGNERVLNARLADARFFMVEDLRKVHEARVEPLKEVVFIDKLGSYYDKTLRMVKLIRPFAKMIGATEEEIALAERAAYLCKADLVTEMVGEFPRLQGVMGYVYTSSTYLSFREESGDFFKVISKRDKGEEISEKRARSIADRPWRSLLHIPLSILPAGIHRFLSDRKYASERLEYLLIRPIRLYFNNALREQWLRDMITEGQEKHLLTDHDAEVILSQIKEPFIQKYLKSLAVHVCTLPVTQVVSLIVAIIYVVTHPEMPRTQAYAIGVGIVALFQVIPISPGSIVRGLYVVYLVIRERNFKDYNIAVFLGFLKYVGYLAFPIQMAYRYPALARFMAAHWATDAVHVVPVFGERGALLEHGVYSLFYNWPLTIRRRIWNRIKVRATLKPRYWHVAMIAAVGTALFGVVDYAYLGQSSVLPTLKEIWILTVTVPFLSGAVVTLGAGGAPLGKRVISAAICGIALGLLYTAVTAFLGQNGLLESNEILVSGAWSVFIFSLLSTIGVLLTEIFLPEPKAQ